jgi:hypothetical protein
VTHQQNFVVDSDKAEKESLTGAGLRKSQEKTPPEIRRRLDFEVRFCQAAILSRVP